MQEFKVGDLVRQRSGVRKYSVTNSDITTILRVEGVSSSGYLKVRVIEHKSHTYVGDRYTVAPSYMCLISSSSCVRVNSLDYQDSDDLTAEDKDIIREFLENV